MQHIGPSLVDVMRRLSMNLADLSGAMVRAGDDDEAVDECPVCSQTIAGDPHQCQGCGVYTHRGCGELVGGCCTKDCSMAADELRHLSLGELVNESETSRKRHDTVRAGDGDFSFAGRPQLRGCAHGGFDIRQS